MMDKYKAVVIVEDSDDDFEVTERAFKKSNLKNPLLRCVDGEDLLDRLKGEGDYSAGMAPCCPGLSSWTLICRGWMGGRPLRFLSRMMTLKKHPLLC